ncbi:hypothetical protein [Labrys wisconsinensis]|uniref:Pilus formation protein N-terminal domain-containing protein n=1 Tax=Labrys wisconsinensis TaxID=425677 RepID=A0ABU0JAC2_9HYPH|nr:hypothetical protein [Labrys wisconsinensis]MDQ0471220.1 hypothetical protein [Labrys wisconsinensis]
MLRALRFLLPALAALLATGHAATALDIGPRAIPLKIAGVPVEVVATAAVDVQTSGDRVALRVVATGDLASIQDNVLEIARHLPLPSDACARKGANLVVNSIDAASITPAGSSVVLSMSGRVTAWACAKVLGAKMKTKITSDTVRITAPVELHQDGPQHVALRLSGQATLETGNPLTAEAASAVVGDLNARLTAALAKALDTASERAALPDLPGLSVTVEKASFEQDQSKVLLRIGGKADMTSAAFNELLDLATRKASP